MVYMNTYAELAEVVYLLLIKYYDRYTSSASSAYVFISLSSMASSRLLMCLVLSYSAPSPEHLPRALTCGIEAAWSPEESC